MNTTGNSATQAKPTILITGATGNIGTELSKQVSEQGVPFRAMVRSGKDVQTLSELPGAEVVIGDFNDPASLETALNGIERAFLLTPSSEQAEAQQRRFVEVAQRAGVRHIIKLSQLAADAHSPVRFLRYHAAVEQAIRESGMAFTFLRPNLFMQGLLNFKDSIASQGKFFAAIGDATVSVVDVRDIATVAAITLTETGHQGKTYTLTGPQALTHADMAGYLSTALHKSVTFVDIPPAAMRSSLADVGLPDWQADGLIEDYAHYSRNEATTVTPAIQAVTGRPPYSFTDFTRDYASAFLSEKE